MATRRYSSDYKILQPYVIEDIRRIVTGGSVSVSGSGGSGGVMEAHTLANTAIHIGTLADAQAPQFLLRDGSRSLTGNLAVAGGITIDGVDLSAHVTDPDAHHPRLHDILDAADHSVNGSAYQVVGLPATDTLGLLTPLSNVTGATKEAVLKSDAAGGLTLHTLTVGTAGATAVSGISAPALGHLVMAAPRSAWLIIDSDNTSTASTFSVRTNSPDPNVAAELMSINEAGTLSVLTGVRTPLLDTASGSMTIAPAVDLLLQPVSTLVKLQSGVALQSHNYASQTTGMRVTGAGEGDFRYLYTDEMHAKSFIADLEQALAGGQIISKSVAELAQDFTVPAAGAAGTLYVRDLPSAPDMAVFQSGDIVRLRQFSRSGGSLTIANAWGVVTSYVDQADGTQRWTFTRSSAPNAGTMTAGVVLAKDLIVLDYGTSGNGFYEVNAIDGLYGLNSPYLQFVRWTGHPATGQVVRLRAGQLRGIFNQDEYGLFAGTGTANSDRWLRLSDYAAGNGINNLPFRMYNDAVEVIHIGGWNDLWIGPSSADKRVTWDGSAFNLLNGGAPVITLASDGTSYFAGVMTIGTSGEIRQGTGTLGSNYTGLRIWRDSNVGRIGGYNANTLQWYADTGGELRAGGGVVAMAADGLGMARYITAAGTPIAGTESEATVAWWDDINSRTGTPLARIYAARSEAGVGGVPSLSIEVDASNADTNSRPSIWLVGKGALPTQLYINYVDQIVGIPGLFPQRNPTTRAEQVDFSGTLNFKAHLLRWSGDTDIDIGTAGNPFRTIYANTVVAGSISGTAMSGQEWEYPGDMLIDANSASNTSLTLTNSGAGAADLAVDRNITLGGTVDGVDLAAFYSAYGTHAANANAHHNQAHVLAGSDHTASGLTAGHVLRASAATAFAWAQLQHADLGGVSADQHHAQAHGLDSADHTGTLAWSKVSKTGSSLADLATRAHSDLTGLTTGNPHSQYALVIRQIVAGAGFTGGGDLSADRTLDIGAGTLISVAADAVSLANGSAQYQVPVTGGSPFTPAWTALSGFAGNGLVFSGGAYAVGVSGLGLSVAADAVTLTSSANPGAAAAILATDSAGLLTLRTLDVLDLYVDGTLDMGTDTLYEDATYLQVAGAKPVNFGQTIRGGSNWSMTTAGALAAASANVAGDLYAAASGFRVINHTHDYAHAHVVINPGVTWTLDEQFGLDIDDNLLVRGWIVGKHAIALPGATLLLHFDGLLPFETNYTGQLVGHLGQVGTPTGGVAFRPGKFNTKALQLAASGTNLINNPSFEVNVTDSWTVSVSGTGGAFTRDTTRSYAGAASARITASTGGNYVIRSNAATLAAGDSITVQCRMRRGSYVNAQLQLRDVTNGSTRVTASPTLIDTWELLTCTWTNSTGSAADVEMRVSNTHGDGAGRIWVDACQMEAGAYMTPYADGSMFTPATWAGTAHNSSSTRAAAHVTYQPVGVVRAAAGTIMAWVQMAGVSTTRQYIVDAGGISADGMYLSIESTGQPRFYYSSSSSVGVTLTATASVTPRTWVHLAATWGPAGAALYVNGVLAASDATSAGGTVFNPALYVGRRYAAVSNWFNGWLDDLAFANQETDADQIRAIYESDAPVFAETSTWHWRAGRNRMWADSEGMWMLNAAGQPMWGAYGGDELDSGATKTWGGVTLSASDILLGDASRSGYVLWDDSAGTITFAGNGAGLTAINGGNITTGSITATQIATNAVTAVKILAGAITADKIDTNAVTAVKISAGAITADKIDTNAVTADKILAGAVTASKISVTDLAAVAAKIGNWDLGVVDAYTLSATGIIISSGGSANARIEVGSGDAQAGIYAVTSDSDSVFWAGSSRANRFNSTTPFRVTRTGNLYATAADISGTIKATAGYIGGTTSGWAIGTGQITSTGIGLYSGAAGTARLEVGSGTNTAGVISGAGAAGDIVMWAGSTYGNRGLTSTPFRVQANGAVYSTAATLDNVSIISGTITQLRAGAAAVQLGTDGQRMVLPNTTGLDVPTSSSAIRWFPTIDGTHDNSKNYAGMVGYRHTSYNVVDMLFTSFVGSTDAATYAARHIIQAGHHDGSTYTDTRIEVVREAGSGDRYVGVYADRMEFNGAAKLMALGSTPAVGASGAAVVVYAKGDKLVFAYNDSGTVRYKWITMSGTGVGWSYSATAP